MSRFNAFAADKKREIFEDLLQGRPPREGAYDAALLKEAQAKGKPQMGATVPYPHQVVLEFSYADPVQGTTLLSVALPVPERVVFLPVPEWVVENIWQGEISGGHYFESEARELVERLSRLLEPEANAPLFGRQAPKRRE